MKSIFVLLITLSFSGLVIGQSEKGLRDFEAGRYSEAIKEWLSLEQAGAKGPEFYYNMGNAYFQLKQYPEAILYYHRALRWDPHCTHCETNLELANQAAGIETFELPQFYLFEVYYHALTRFQPLTWFIWAMVLASLAASIWMFRSSLTALPGLRFWIVLFGIMAVIYILAAVHRDAILHRQDQAILMQASPLFRSPDPRSEVLLELLPGQVLTRKDQLSGWVKVQVSSVDMGWVEADRIQWIRL